MPKKSPHSKWLKVIAAAVLLGGVVLLASGFLVEEKEQPQQSCAIVVISGGAGERIRKGINLYHEGWAPTLILSGGVYVGDESNAATMRDLAISREVPADNIIVEPDATTTFENAQNTRQILEEAGCPENKILLVTSEYHSQRADDVFTDELAPVGIEVISTPAKTSDWNKLRWWKSKRGWYLTGSELAKMTYTAVTGKSER